jgi:hypothetical protein
MGLLSSCELVALAATNTFIRSILVGDDPMTVKIWAQARECVPSRLSIPPPPPLSSGEQLSEFMWAHFLFGTSNCYVS